MVYELAGSVGTENVAVHDPWASAAIPEPTVVWPKVTEIPLSLAVKPTPLTETVVPGAARSRLSDTPGTVTKDVSRTGAEPPDRMAYVPEADGGMVTVALQEPSALAVSAEATVVWPKVTAIPL
jgi:hypothetical protein